MKNILFFYFLFFVKIGFSQTFPISNFQFNKLYFNPAYSGIDITIGHITSNHRQQWINADTEAPLKFRNNLVMTDLPFYCKAKTDFTLGAGFILENSSEGYSKYMKTKFSPSISLKWDNFFNHDAIFSIGLNYQLSHSVILNSTSLVFTDQINYYNNFISSQNFPTEYLGYGIFHALRMGFVLREEFKNQQFESAISYKKILGGNQGVILDSEYKAGHDLNVIIDWKVNRESGYKKNKWNFASKKTPLLIGMLYEYQQPLSQFTFNIHHAITFNTVFGLGWRNKIIYSEYDDIKFGIREDAILFMFEFYPKKFDGLLIGFSSDFPYSSGNPSSYTTFDLTLKWIFRVNSTKRCPCYRHEDKQPHKWSEEYSPFLFGM